MSKRLVTQTNDRNYFIDLLKGFAIIFVILHHSFRLCPTMPTPTQLGFPFWVYQGVPIFLLVSGYVWSLSYTRKGITKISQCYSPVILLKRLIRIMIPFFVMFFIEMIISASINTFPNYNWLKLLFIGGMTDYGNYYFLILIQLVIFLPLLYFIIKRFQIKGLLGCYIFNILFECVRWAVNLPAFYYDFIIFRFTIVIAYGVYLSFNYQKKQNIWLSIACFVVGLGSLIWFFYTPYHCKFFYDGNWKHTNFLTLLYIIPICGFLIRKCDIPNKYVGILGKSSYSFFIGQNVILIFNSIFCFSEIDSLKIITWIGFIFAFSILFYIAIEWLATSNLIKLTGLLQRKWHDKYDKK